MSQQQNDQLRLLYTIFCDDVRLEVGNKLSLMGVFQNIMVEQLPVTLIKFGVVNHWRGGTMFEEAQAHLSEVRVLSPDRQHPIVVSQPTRFQIAPGGFADNVSFFVNVTFPAPGDYIVQTLIDSTLFDEQTLTVADLRSAQTAAAMESDTESVN